MIAPSSSRIGQFALDGHKRRKRTKDDASSLAISLCIHLALLLFLSWFLVITEKRPAVSLTIQTVPRIENRVLVSLPQTNQAPPQVSDIDVPIDVDLIPDEEFLASINPSDLRPRLEPKSVEFFGSHAYGNRFVYILDVSTSMTAREHERFARARDELIRSVSKLSPKQSYYVFLFCWQTSRMYAYPNRHSNKKRDTSRWKTLEFVDATPENLGKLRRWLYDVKLGSGTDPRRALSLAHSMKPDAVFLLSDGQFNRPVHAIGGEGWISTYKIPFESTVPEGVRFALANVPVHTIAFENPFTRKAMKKIADATGGTTRYVKTRSLRPIDPSDLINGLRRVRSRRDKYRGRLEPQYVVRIEHAKHLLEAGELAFAEYMARPARGFDFQSEDDRRLADQVFKILDTELGDVRLEDFDEVSIAEIEEQAITGRRK